MTVLEPEAGHVGVPVDAICTGCRETRVKRAPADEVDDVSEADSFRHVCHNCQTCTWWNVRSVLQGLIREIRGEKS